MLRFTFLLFFMPVLSGAALGRDGSPPKLSLSGDFSLELLATWEELTDTVYKFETRYPLLQNPKPSQERRGYGAEHFRPLLPRDRVDVGAVWSVDAKDVLPFLKQFHPGATDQLHHAGGGQFGIAAPGAWACLRALSPDYAEVVFRVHADFLLEGDGARGATSWMTPAQFEGRMVIDRVRGVVSAFELSLPSQSANVDLNMATGHGISADIGRIPRMDLRGASHPALPPPTFTNEIDLEEAKTLLRRKFYRFAEVEWLELEEALAQSKATDKPLHVVALFGSLTDESC